MGRRRGDRADGAAKPWYPKHQGDEDGAHGEKIRMQFDDADTAFILGKGGKTKHKIARVSGAQLELHERNNVVDIWGAGEECRKAQKYIMLVQAQRVGPVRVDESHDDGDLTMMDVPTTCVGFVTGSGGNFLRTCEEEWGTLMFFCDIQGPHKDGTGTERLAIFGQRRGREGSQLKVMAAIEAKLPGHFTTGARESCCADEWGTDTLLLGTEDLSFVLGKEGSTRKKLARASGCILEYVGGVAYMVGNQEERGRCRDYITWLIQQRTGKVFIDHANRSDATSVEVPRDLTGILKGSTLRDIEYETDTFCFLEGDVDNSDCVLIFGPLKGRKQAERRVRDLVRARPPRQAPESPQERGGNADNSAVKAEIRISAVVAEAMDPERLSAIQTSTGAKVTQQGTEYVSVQGNEQQVSQAKRVIHDYIFNLKVEEEFVTPKEVPFHAFIAKGADGKPSVLEEVRNQTRVRVKVLPNEKKIILGGLFSVVSQAKRDLQLFLNSFVTHHVQLEKSQIEQVSTFLKQSLPKMQHFRHLSAAQVNKESSMLTLSGTPESVAEAHTAVDEFFRSQGWHEPQSEVFSTRHAMRGKHAESRGGDGGTRKAGEVIQLTEPDSAFILGRGGKTKHKIARVSGAALELHEHNNTVEIIGTDLERRKARKYVDLVRAQRVGPVTVDESHDDGDLTMIAVPTDCVGFVTGSQGNFLRSCEEEWATLMFFCDFCGPHDEAGATERLAIFGNRAGRTGAELKVMAAVETKRPGHFTRNVDDRCTEDEWGRDTLPLTNDELSFALGKDGSTRKKLAKASGCILEYVGNVAYMAGSISARKRARDYLDWLMKQRVGTVYVDCEGRNDVSIVDIPGGMESVASVFKSLTLRAIEQETRTFCFLEGNASKSDRLLIFGEKACREKAKAVALEKIESKIQAQDDDRWYRGNRQGGNHGGGNHGGGNHNHGGGNQGGYGGYRGGWSENYNSNYGSNYNSNYGSNHHSKNNSGNDGGGGGGRAEQAEVSDTFALRGDVSVHVVIQTGPNGEDPVVEDVENSTGTKLTLLRDKGLIQIHGSAERVAQAKRQLQQFSDKFVTCKIQMKPQITAALANKVSHYIRPMPWIAAAEVDESADVLKIQGHQDSVDQTFKVLREVYRDHGFELTDADIVTRKKASEEQFASRTVNIKGRAADVLRVSEDDAAFILGRGGKTKQKIARVSRATLELHERTNTVEIYGSDEERRKARKYVELVRAQRVGPVSVGESHDDGDLTMIAVPHNCVGFVTGSQGNFLRTCEDEWGTLMFFCDYQGPTGDGLVGSERLAIFGDLAGRCGAELKVMAAIETKIPGYYTTNLGDTHSDDDWSTDTVPLSQDQLSYALGKKGSTRRKVAKASGAILEYVGNIAFLAGPLVARRRCREYLGWLCDQVACKTGRISIDPQSRDDVTLVPVPKDCIGYVMGDKRNTLSRLEEDWETLIFFVDNKSLPAYQDVEGLAIFGAERGRAGTELKVMGAVETKLPQFFTKGVGHYQSPHEWGVDTLPLGNEELSFALGKDGGTRRKLARASGCILEYVGNTAYMAGTIAERARASDYLNWLIKQRTGPIRVDFKNRDDISVVEIPDELAGMTKASSLRDVERETGTFVFFQGDTSTSHALLVCGHREEDRQQAEAILQDMLVRGAARPKPPKKRQPPHQQQGAVQAPPPRRQGAARRPAPAEDSSGSSDSGSESGSDSDYSSQSSAEGPGEHAERRPPPMRQREGGRPPQRITQWASEGSGSGSDEELVPYW